MDIRRLGWAGIEIHSEGHVAVVDLFENWAPLAPFLGEPHTPLPGPSGPVDLALVTHLHADHADPPAIAAALRSGAPVLRPAPAMGEGLETIALTGAEQGFAEHGLATRAVAEWETVEVGPFRCTALPAVDGFGDPQVSWLVEAEGMKLLHCGDTALHGSWWLIAMRHGPVDVAFFPVNGPRCAFPHRTPAMDVPAAMDPVQAANAARAVRAQLAVPVHYDTIHHPPTYDAIEGAEETFVREAAALGVNARIVAPGRSL